MHLSVGGAGEMPPPRPRLWARSCQVISIANLSPWQHPFPTTIEFKSEMASSTWHTHSSTALAKASTERALLDMSALQKRDMIEAWVKKLTDVQTVGEEEQSHDDTDTNHYNYHRWSHPPTPPLSRPDMEEESTPTRKRQRRDGNQRGPDPDLDLTPRHSDGGSVAGSSGMCPQDMLAASLASPSHSSKSARSSRSQSQSQPLKKHLMRLRLADDGLQLRQLKLGTCPRSISPLLCAMISISNGLHILPNHLRDEIHAS